MILRPYRVWKWDENEKWVGDGWWIRFWREPYRIKKVAGHWRMYRWEDPCGLKAHYSRV